MVDFVLWHVILLDTEILILIHHNQGNAMSEEHEEEEYYEGYVHSHRHNGRCIRQLVTVGAIRRLFAAAPTDDDIARLRRRAELKQPLFD